MVRDSEGRECHDDGTHVSILILKDFKLFYFIISTEKIVTSSRYRYRPVTVPLPSRYHFWLALPIEHHRDTPLLFLTVPNRYLKDG